MTNRKLRIAFLSFTTLMLIILSYTAFQYYSLQARTTSFEGTGTSNNPYLIKDEDDYLLFANCVNNGTHYENTYFALDTDLDYKHINTIVGIPDSDFYFAGYFDGRGHKFLHVNISTGEEPAGLFNNLNGLICNVIVEDGTIEGHYAGAITGSVREHAEILNCLNKAEIIGKSTNGIAGKQLLAELSNCVSYMPNEEGVMQTTISRIVEDDRAPIIHDIDGNQTEQDCNYLNQHLNALSTYYSYPNWCTWDSYGSELILTHKTANTLVKMSANITLDNEPFCINAYWGLNDTWYFAIPAGWEAVDIPFTLTYADGSVSTHILGADVSELHLADSGYNYHIAKLISKNVSSIMINTNSVNSMHYLNYNKLHALPGNMIMSDTNGKLSYSGYVKELAGHGHDSWKIGRKKSYNIKLAHETTLAGMGNSKNYALLAAYRNNSLLSYMVAQQIEHDADIPFAPGIEPVNFYLDGTYMGIYLLSERPELAFSRIEVPNGYLLQFNRDDYVEWEKNFFTERDIVITVENKNISNRQFHSLQSYWQDFENALFSEDGYNDKGIYYADYIDLKSFADQWLMYELCGEQSVQGSVYYYKESDVQGDGLLHAAYVWDMENSFTKDPNILYLSSNTHDLFDNYWGILYSHPDFAQEVLVEWNTTFSPIVSELLNSMTQNSGPNTTSLQQTFQKYNHDFYINETNWPSCDFKEKTDDIQIYMAQKSYFLNCALPLYSEGYDYIQAEDGWLYGAIISDENNLTPICEY